MTMKKTTHYLTEKKLGEIFSEILPNKQFIHDKTVPNSNCKMRPDYRFEDLKLIVEFDGNRHYQQVEVILKDEQKDNIYKKLGYRIVRIPYFIQMTNKLLQGLFNQEFVYTQVYPHGFIDDNVILPATFCELGIKRFLNDLENFANYREDIILSLQKK